jgi:hypothetical protein
MNKVKWLPCIAIIALTMGMLTTGCNTNSEDTEGNYPGLVLRSYEVPAEYAAEVSSIINNLLTPAGGLAPLGAASISRGGVVVVTAPASVHAGIEKMIADIGKTKPEPASMVSLTYWIVVGTPAKETALSAQLNEIEPALKAVSTSEGPMAFSLLERLKVQSMSGKAASLVGSFASVEQRATVRESSVLGDISVGLIGIPGRHRDFVTKVQIGLDNVLVLGQSGYPQQRTSPSREELKSEAETSIFYIVRARAE